MNKSTIQRMNVSHLARLLRQLRRQHKVSLNALSKLSGLSRRTLARLESGHGPVPSEVEGPRATGHRSRTLMKLLRLFMPESRIEVILQDATKLSRAYALQLGGDPEDYRLLDLLPDLYPYFLFHPPRHALDEFIRKKYAPDYRTSLHQLVLRPPRNLGHRLRAFRLRHDLTLVQTAALLGLSKSELHRIERNQRSPSAPTAFRILRLLTAPSSAGHRLRDDNRPGSAEGEKAALQPRWVGVESTASTDHGPRACPEGSRGATDHDPMDSLRRLWLSGPYKTRELAALLGISQPHLIRLLRGYRAPSKALLERIAQITSDA